MNSTEILKALESRFCYPKWLFAHELELVPCSRADTVADAADKGQVMGNKKTWTARQGAALDRIIKDCSTSRGSWAEAHSIGKGFLCDIVKGRRSPSQKVIQAVLAGRTDSGRQAVLNLLELCIACEGTGEGKP